MKKLFAVLAAAFMFAFPMLAATPAYATTTVIADFDGEFGSFSATKNGPFDDLWDFTVPFDGTASVGVIGVKVTGLAGLNLDSVTFNGQQMFDSNPDVNIFEFTLTDIPVLAGTQVVELIGSGRGSYGGSVSYTALPEPATWAMMLLGFGFIGVSMRRRRNASMRTSLAPC